jgi:DNA-binding MarR family transcriptional regulator
VISAEHMGERFITLYHRLHRAADDYMSASGLSLTRTKVLRQLQRSGPTRQGVLAARFGVVPHSITDIVDGLERDGFAERQPDPADRRAKLVVLTDKGAAALVVAGAAREKLLNQVFGAIDPDEREVLSGLLNRLETAASALITSGPPRPDCARPQASTNRASAIEPEGNGRHVIA